MGGGEGQGFREVSRGGGHCTRGVWVLACLLAGFDWVVWFFDFAAWRGGRPRKMFEVEIDRILLFSRRFESRLLCSRVNFFVFGKFIKFRFRSLELEFIVFYVA